MSGTDHRKGQIWVLDFTTGLIALTFILMAYMFIWNLTALRWNLTTEHTEMESSAYFASESLLATPGEPESWEMLPQIDGNISAFGIVSSRNVINLAKLNRLVAANLTSYPLIKSRLGLERYQFGMQITDLTRNIIYYQFGEAAQGNLNNSLDFDRFAILNGNPVIVHMEVWGG